MAPDCSCAVVLLWCLLYTVPLLLVFRIAFSTYCLGLGFPGRHPTVRCCPRGRWVNRKKKSMPHWSPKLNGSTRKEHQGASGDRPLRSRTLYLSEEEWLNPISSEARPTPDLLLRGTGTGFQCPGGPDPMWPGQDPYSLSSAAHGVRPSPSEGPTEESV
jgi:hypothetical protein